MLTKFKEIVSEELRKLNREIKFDQSRKIVNFDHS